MTRTEPRTDIHRPSAEEFNPQQYEEEGCWDLHPDAMSAPDRIAVTNRLLAEGYKFTGAWGLGRCDHCGATVRYTALMSHQPTKGLIWVGEECLWNRFGLSSAEFHKLRETARLNRERQTKAEKLQKALDGFDAAAIAAYQWATNDTEASHIAVDIARKIEKYYDPSEKQLAFLVKLHTEHLERERRKAERAAAVDAGEITPCPEGRQTVRGVILSVKWVDDEFSYNGGTLKMLVQDERGFRVYGTCPSSLSSSEELRGSVVEFSANLQPKAADPTFGFYSRPTKARLITGPETSE